MYVHSKVWKKENTNVPALKMLQNLQKNVVSCFKSTLFLFRQQANIPIPMSYTIVFVNPFSAGTDFRRQNLTSKVDPRTKKITIFTMAVDP